MEQNENQQYDNRRKNPGVAERERLLDLLRGALPAMFTVNEEHPEPLTVGEARVEYVHQWEPDLVVRVTPPHGKEFYFAIEFKNQPYPSHVIGALEQLQAYIRRAPAGRRIYPLLVVPHVTPETGEFIKTHGVNYLDFAGNRRIEAEDLLYQEVQGRKNTAPAPKPELAMFTPTGTRIVQALLLAPPNHFRDDARFGGYGERGTEHDAAHVRGMESGGVSCARGGDAVSRYRPPRITDGLGGVVCPETAV